MACFYSLVAVILLFTIGRAAILTPDQHILGPEKQTSTSKALEKVRQKLQKAEIIPTVIDDFPPSLILEAKWSHHNQASLGNTLKPKKLQDSPSISLHDPSGKSSTLCDDTFNSKVPYVITLTDPDAPSRDDPKWSEMCHWIAISSISKNPNQSCCSLDLNLDDDNEIIPYKPPGPPEKTGQHRYALFAFVPVNGTTDKIYPSKPKDRKNWGYDGPDKDTGKTHGVRDWAKENGLVPVAANFIYAKNKKQ